MKKLVIVISGPPGSGTTTIGKKLAKKLRLKFFSPGLYFKKMSKSKREGKAALELIRTKFGTSERLHKHIDNLQVKMAKKGNIIVEGALSIHFLKRLSNCKIWLNAPIKVRAERTAHRDKITYDHAYREIKEREGIERKSWKKIYGFDYFNQKKDADLSIDTSGMTINQAVNKLLKFIEQKGFNS